MINYDYLEKVGEYKNGSLHWYEGRDINAVYLIRMDNEFYIGSTQYVYTRIQAHISLLRKGQHTSYKMQEMFNNNSDFSIYVLERGIDGDLLLSREMFYIQEYHPSLNVIVASTKKKKIEQLRIKEVIKAKGLTMQQVAETLGVTRDTLTRNINGNPTVETLSKIADALEVEITDLFERKKEEKDVIICPKCGSKFKLLE